MEHRIREYRIRRGMTQGALAQRLHVDRTSIVKLESGESGRSYAKLPALAKALGCRIDDLFEEMDGYTPEVPAQDGARVEDPGPEAPAREPGPDEDVSIDDLFEL